MLLLATNAMPTTLRHITTPQHLGRLLTPRHYNRLTDQIASGMSWAVDNDGFQGVDFDKYEQMCEAISMELWAADRFNRPAFVTVPDVVEDAPATMDLFDEWEPFVHDYGLPAALVLQDGVEQLPIPWDRLEAVFVGGSTEWKLGTEAAELVAEAKRRGKWAHMGRVNSFKRMNHAHAIGCDSVDGTKYARFSKTHLPAALAHLAKLDSQPTQMEIAA